MNDICQSNWHTSSSLYAVQFVMIIHNPRRRQTNGGSKVRRRHHDYQGQPAPIYSFFASFSADNCVLKKVPSISLAESSSARKFLLFSVENFLLFEVLFECQLMIKRLKISPELPYQESASHCSVNPQANVLLASTRGRSIYSAPQCSHEACIQGPVLTGSG